MYIVHGKAFGSSNSWRTKLWSSIAFAKVVQSMQGKNNGERKNRVKKIENSSCSLLSHFWSTFGAVAVVQILGSQESNASNGVRIGAEMRKIWPSQDNYIQLISIRVEIPSGCRHFHPDVSHPESGYCHLHPAPHPPPGWHPEFRIQMGKEAFQLPRSAMSGSSMAFTRITPSWRQNVAQL